MITLPKPPIHLSTSIPNLYLRSPQLTLNDAQGLSRYFSHIANHRFDGADSRRKDSTPEYYSKKIPEWLEAANRGEYYVFVVILSVAKDAVQNEIVGIASYNSFDHQEGRDGRPLRIADIGMGIHEPHLRKGFGSAVLQTLIENAFDVFGADLVAADTAADNKPFQELIEKLKLDRFASRRVDDGVEEVLYSFSKTQWQQVS